MHEGLQLDKEKLSPMENFPQCKPDSKFRRKTSNVVKCILHFSLKIHASYKLTIELL